LLFFVGFYENCKELELEGIGILGKSRNLNRQVLEY